ncbi:MAG TPA: tetratricopeptide repeat protein [bacterium]
MKRSAILVILTGVIAAGVDIAENYFVKGVESYDAGDIQKAIQQYTYAVKLQPEVGIYRLALGTAFGKNNQYQEALPHLKKAVEYDSTLTDAYYLIEDYYAKTGGSRQAFAFFSEQRQLHPERAAIAINLGHLYYRSGDTEKAIAEYSTAQILDPGNPVPFCGLGVVALAQGRDSIAEGFFLSALEMDSTYAAAHLYYSYVLERKGMLEQAAVEKEIAFRLKPELKDLDLSGILPLRGEKADIPFIVSTLDIIIDKLVRPEERRALMAMRKPFDLNLGLGFASVDSDSTLWLALTSAPEMDMNWLGFKLSLGFFFNQNGDMRQKELDYTKIFQNVRIGHPNLPVHAGFGVVRDYTLGYGLIVRSYFNQADENNRKLGGLFTLQTPTNTIGIHGMLNDFKDRGVIAGHAFLGRWAPYPEDVFQRFELGCTYAQDADNELKVVGGDALVYLASSGKFHFLFVTEGAKIQEHGFGDMSGLMLHFGGLSPRAFSFSLFGAGLFLAADFVPAPFDAFYEKNRKQYGSNAVSTMLADYQSAGTGMYTMTGLQLGPVIKLTVDLQSVSGVPESGVFSCRGIVGDDIPYVKLQGFFYKYQFDDMSTLTTMDENTYVAGLAGIKLVGELLSVNFLYERTYAWQETSGSYEVQERISPFIQFGTRF